MRTHIWLKFEESFDRAMLGTVISNVLRNLGLGLWTWWWDGHRRWVLLPRSPPRLLSSQQDKAPVETHAHTHTNTTNTIRRFRAHAGKLNSTET